MIKLTNLTHGNTILIDTSHIVAVLDKGPHGCFICTTGVKTKNGHGLNFRVVEDFRTVMNDIIVAKQRSKSSGRCRFGPPELAR